MSKFKSQLEALMKMRGVRQKDAADSLKVTPMTLNRYFRTESELRGDALVGLCKLCGVDVEKEIEKALVNDTQQASREQIHPGIALFNVILELDEDRRKILVDFMGSFLKNSLPGRSFVGLSFKEFTSKK